MASVTQCSIQGCQNPKLNLGYCNAHYLRLRRHGSPLGGGKSPESHGMARSSEYNSWEHIKERVKPTYPRHRDYYDRGITVCVGYQRFSNFFADLGYKPEPEYSVDRENNDNGYWCGKCQECVANQWSKNIRWASDTIQRSNMRLLSSRNKSGYRGVSWDKKANRWISSIGFEGKSKRLGGYKTAREAAIVYNAAAISLHGEFAILNPLS